MYECEHCGKQFTRERTLMVHVCEQKRRYMQRDEKGVQVGFLAYNRFFQLAQGATKDKTYQHFAIFPKKIQNFGAKMCEALTNNKLKF